MSEPISILTAFDLTALTTPPNTESSTEDSESLGAETEKVYLIFRLLIVPQRALRDEHAP